PTAWLDVRYTGVSRTPHSAIEIDPVSSPAPFKTAVPAGTGCAQSVSTRAGSTALTPVRATPRPSGYAGSSRQTVTCPTVTPLTSVIAFAGPASNRPIRRPSWRSRGPRCAGASMLRILPQSLRRRRSSAGGHNFDGVDVVKASGAYGSG